MHIYKTGPRHWYIVPHKLGYNLPMYISKAIDYGTDPHDLKVKLEDHNMIEDFNHNHCDHNHCDQCDHNH